MLSHAQARMLNDLLYGLLISTGLSPADSQFVMSLERSPSQRRRRQQDMATHAPDLLGMLRDSILSLGGTQKNAG